MVDFAHYNIFCSDFDTEMRVEDVGDIKEYLVRKRNEYINMLIKVKNKNTIYSGDSEQPLKHSI